MNILNSVPADLRRFCSYDHGSLGIYHVYGFYSYIRSKKRLKEVVRELRKKESSCAKYRQEHDWTGYLLIHESPHRAFALFMVRNLVEDSRQYWELLQMIWMHDAYSGPKFWPYVSLLSDTRSGREHLMTDSDRGTFDALPDEFLIWRGTTKRKKAGWSWTLNIEVALWFAKRKREPEMVIEAVCRKADVIAYLNGRKEEEIIIDPKNVKVRKRVDVTECPQITPPWSR